MLGELRHRDNGMSHTWVSMGQLSPLVSLVNLFTPRSNPEGVVRWVVQPDRPGGSGVCRCPYPTTHGDNMPTEFDHTINVYNALVTYRDSILTYHRWLAGEEVPPTAAADGWQILAGNLSRELLRYADVLDGISKGKLGPMVVFPSWDEPKADKGYDDVSGFMAAVRHDIQLAKEEKKAEGGAS